jgi:hypothetical protein
VQDILFPLARRCGWNAEINSPETAGADEALALLRGFSNSLGDEISSYVRQIAFVNEAVPYSGALLTFHDFLWPALRDLRSVQGLPSGPVFLLIDDADNLSSTQTEILNTWVSTRCAQDVSLKISTQLNYLHYRTVAGQRIQAPHDFSEINISDIYTSNKDDYRRGVVEVVKRRLDMVGLVGIGPHEFFPPNATQEKKIKKEEERLKAEWALNGRGFRPGDDAVRYARPNYMRSLAGKSKSSHTYSYAGFDQLVDISSGVVRHFLDAASKMYAEEINRSGGSKITNISHEVQSRVAYELSNELLEAGLAQSTRQDPTDPESHIRQQKLLNVVVALGGMFRSALLGDSSERRVFSVALTDRPVEDIMEVFELGVQNGYFHRTTIGNKEGTGRTLLFVLSRRLAPAFKLDPSGFAGHRFLTNDALREAMRNPKSFLRQVTKASVDDPGMPQLPGLEVP